MSVPQNISDRTSLAVSDSPGGPRHLALTLVALGSSLSRLKYQYCYGPLRVGRERGTGRGVEDDLGSAATLLCRTELFRRRGREVEAGILAKRTIGISGRPDGGLGYPNSHIVATAIPCKNFVSCDRAEHSLHRVSV